MELLDFINTNHGVVAVRRHKNAELLYYSQVWLRENTGEWKRYHYYSKDDGDFSSNLLEAFFENIDEDTLCYEDWW